MNSKLSGTSKGNQAKEWTDNGSTLIKYDSINWYESISEVLVSELLSHIKGFKAGIDYVDYTWVNDKGNSACSCQNFLKEGEFVISLYALIEGYNFKDLSGFELKNAICGIIFMETGLNIEEYLSCMMYIDAMVLNEDRHLRNISFISNGTSVRLTPYYDFGLSLMSDKTMYENIEDLSFVKSQPFSTDFIEQANLFINPDIRLDYEKLVLKLNHVVNHSSSYISIESKASDLERAIFVLLRRLRETEGVLWKRV